MSDTNRPPEKKHSLRFTYEELEAEVADTLERWHHLVPRPSNAVDWLEVDCVSVCDVGNSLAHDLRHAMEALRAERDRSDG